MEEGQVYMSERLARLQARKTYKQRGYMVDDLITVDITKETLLESDKVNAGFDELK